MVSSANTENSGQPPTDGTRKLVLPLDVTLEELYKGVQRRVSVNRMLLQRAGRVVEENTFDVRIEPGALDGHRVIFPGKAGSLVDGKRSEDVCFVLQERRSDTWRRKGADLFTERAITLLEALTGYRILIEHLDGRKLIVKSRPGEIVKPRTLLLNAEAEWERHDNMDAFALQDAGCMRTDDLEACKEVCRQRGLSGFTYWEDTAYFRAQARDALLSAKRQSNGSTLFVCPDPAKSASVRMQRAIRGEGMPHFDNPSKKGNLFLLLRVDLPRHLDPAATKVLREVLPAGTQALQRSHQMGDESIEEFDLVDLDPNESVRQHHIITGALPGSHVGDNDEAPPAGSLGPPPCRQM